MATVDDVAAAVLERTGPIDTFKLQKLVYYCQAWHLVWEDGPLFGERIEAWANGPVVPDLYRRHRGRYSVSEWPDGDVTRLTSDEASTVEAVVEFYGHRGGQELAELTHREDPWLRARGAAGLALGDRGDAEITVAAMNEYYGSLVS